MFEQSQDQQSSVAAFLLESDDIVFDAIKAVPDFTIRRVTQGEVAYLL